MLSQFQNPKGGPRCPIVGGEGRFKKHLRVSACSVPDVTKQKSAFHDSWFSNNQ